MEAFTRAKPFFERALQQYPKHLQTIQLYAEFLINANQSDDAIATINIALAEHPDSQPLRVLLGLAHLAHGEITAAQEQADILDEQGYSFPKLKDKLASVGVQ
jgi:predicted Zn-dependent protease